MNVPLKRQDQEWLEAQVASGRFASLAEAVETAVAKLKSDDVTDDAWAKPFVDDALAALERGEGTPWKKGAALRTIKTSRTSSA